MQIRAIDLTRYTITLSEPEVKQLMAILINLADCVDLDDKQLIEKLVENYINEHTYQLKQELGCKD